MVRFLLLLSRGCCNLVAYRYPHHCSHSIVETLRNPSNDSRSFGLVTYGHSD